VVKLFPLFVSEVGPLGVMCERARRSRDASSRYSIDTLFPGLSNNSTHSRTSPAHCALGLGLGTQSTSSSESSHDQLRSSTRNKKNINSSESEGIMPANNTTARNGTGNNGLVDVLINAPSAGESTNNDNNGLHTPTNLHSNRSAPAPVSTSSGSKKRAGSPLKPATQPKQITLLSTTKMSRKTMLEVFQPWVLQTYGDSAKTKTITKKKYYRIVKTLRGEEINNAENSKFRFWVKAKGFHIGPPPGHSPPKDDRTTSYSNEPDLFVPTTVKVCLLTSITPFRFSTTFNLSFSSYS